MNIASGGSPDLSLSASSSSKSDPPWADEVSHARQGLAKRLANLEPGNTKGVPWPIISKKGQQVAVRFKLAPSADFSHFMVDAVTRLGEDPHAGAPSSGPLVRVQAYDSPVARHILILPSLQSPPASNESQTSPDTNQLAAATPPSPLNTSVSDQSNQPSAASNSVSIVIFQSLVGDPTTEVEYMRRGRFTERELDAIANGVKIGIGKPEGKRDEKPLRSSEPNEQVAREKRKTRGRVAAALSKLESMGVIVYGAETLSEEDGEEKPANSEGATWGHLAGYEEQKQEIEDTILLALQRPEVYDRIARGTRREYESNRPRAILFDGPPGTGKTSTARVIAGRAGVPLLYVPLEAVASKYYGESERLLAAVFNAGKDFPHGCLVFLDEIDALATERDSGMHEATRRVLSVLLRQLDGFEPDRRTIVIAATNRKEDLDAALLSRFDTALTFGLPDFRTRQEIFAQYAQHLSASDREAVAAATESMSGRDIRDICEQAERHWASKVIRAQVPQELPTLEEYLRCCKARRQTVAKAEPPKSRPQNRSELAQQFA
ncbi:AAA-type ATPase family protein [Klebsormidium nitens]|uniref:AAA-type ATPase family protein n=1 Tax=Klebsormidium nitens TaxID=105231 RepID=A0A1Y1I5W6_KLENI|nr:AAA-type ATPase family protein [Klebsormidium nitens]|eukprot:GAQ86354.1 AAA-type ATPase family protein [Klebsormidium nitens]